MSTLLPPSYIPTIDEQKMFIGTGLHSALLFQFLMAMYRSRIYVGVFVVTLNIYGHKEQQHRSYHKLIIASIVLIFLITLISFVLCWWLVNTVFCNDADTRFSIVLANATARLPLPLQTLLEISGYAGFVLADGVLVWRCFHACGGRLTASFLLPMGMFIVEIALGFAALAFNLLTARSAPAASLVTYYKAYNHITGAAFAVIAATSIMATFLICKTIHTHTTHSRSARKRLSHIVDSLTQSCGIYTAVAVMHAVIDIVLNTGVINNSTSLTVTGISNYSTTLIYAMSGLIPTLMVARLATTSKSTDKSSRESEPYSLTLSLPPQLGDQSDAEWVSTGTASPQIDSTQSAGEEVEWDNNGGIVEETRDKQRAGHDEESL